MAGGGVGDGGASLKADMIVLIDSTSNTHNVNSEPCPDRNEIVGSLVEIRGLPCCLLITEPEQSERMTHTQFWLTL